MNVLLLKVFCYFSFKMVVEVVPDYAVDIPLIWQYIGEIIGKLTNDEQQKKKS